MHSGYGGLDSANVRMEVRSSPGGARVRLREEFPPACVGASLPETPAGGSLKAGLNRAARRLCAGGVGSWPWELVGRPLDEWGVRRLLFG